MYRYFKRVSVIGKTNYIYFWKSKRLSDENIIAPTISDYKINPELSYFGTKTRVEFNASCWKQDKITYNHKKVVNIHTVYQINKNFNIRDYPTLENCLFGAVSWTKNADINNYNYLRYGIGFNRHGFYSHPSGGTRRNVIIFGVDISLSTRIDNRKKIF